MPFGSSFADVFGVLSQARDRGRQIALDEQLQPLKIQTLGAQLQDINESVRQLKMLNDLLDKGLKEGENQIASLDDAHAAIQEATTPRERSDALAQAFTADPTTFGFPSGFASDALTPGPVGPPAPTASALEHAQRVLMMRDASTPAALRTMLAFQPDSLQAILDLWNFNGTAANSPHPGGPLPLPGPGMRTFPPAHQGPGFLQMSDAERRRQLSQFLEFMQGQP